MTPRTLYVFLLAVAIAAATPGLGWAQAGRGGKVMVTVVDQAGGVVPNASVSLTGLEDATRRTKIAPVRTSEQGLATFENVTPGRYAIQAEFPGFETGLLRSVTVRAGDNRQVVTLTVQGVSDSVTVTTDAADRASSSFGQTVTKEEIDALPDDPTQMEQQILDLAGQDAIIRVDSFEGAQLPPKSQIKSIHVVRDQFAAETADPGSTYVDIITQPGQGAISGSSGFNYRDPALDGKSQFVATKGPSRNQNFNGNIGGAIQKDKSNFSASIYGANSFSTPILHQGTDNAVTLGVRQPDNYVSGSGLFDYAITKDQTLRIGYQQYVEHESNLGIGDYASVEHGYSSQYNGFNVRIQEAGPISRRSFLNTRLYVGGSHSQSTSNVEAPTIVIQNDRTIGGAQQAGGSRSVNFQLASDLDYIHGINSWRTGLLISGNWSDSNTNQNYLGTYTFADEASYAAGQPLTYTQSVGDPTVKYLNVQSAFYVQDDLRIRKNLTLSPGVRYSLQTHVADKSAVAPRFGVTWSPFKSGHTSLRASAGLFSGWLGTGTYEQALRNDGQHQASILLVKPSYPDPGPNLTTVPPQKFLIGNYNLQRNLRYSAGIDQTLSPRMRISVLYNYVHLIQQPRGENLNPLVDGVRPDPNFTNIIETVTDAEIRRHELYVNYTMSLVAPGPTAMRARFDARRIGLTAGYSIIHARNNSQGAFYVPPSGTPATEWGPGPADRPFRINLSLVSTQLRNLNVRMMWSGSSGSPYTLTTGLDDNGDGIINDRPPGVGLNSLRTPRQYTLGLFASYTLATVGAANVPAGTPGAPRSYRIALTFNANNLTNHANYGGYSGVMTSSTFMQPQSVVNPRVVNMGITFNF